MPFHLLSGVGIYAFLFSSAKITHFTPYILLRFLFILLPKNLHCRVRTTLLFIKNSIRLAAFWSLSKHLLSGLPLKVTWLEPPHNSFESARNYSELCVILGFLTEWKLLSAACYTCIQLTFPTYVFIGYPLRYETYRFQNFKERCQTLFSQTMLDFYVSLKLTIQIYDFFLKNQYLYIFFFCDQH